MQEIKKYFEKIVKKNIREIYNLYKKNILKLTNSNELIKSKIDPTSFIFSQIFRNKNFKETIELEINRKIDKSILNSLGKFHENLLTSAENCMKPNKFNVKNFNNSIYKGFDLVYKNPKTKKIEIIAEIKNKHNTTNSSSSETIYLKMLNAVANDPDVKCYLVEIISTNSKNEKWVKNIKGNKYENNRIRKISVDKFWKCISSELNFKKIWEEIKKLMNKVVKEEEDIHEDFTNVYNNIKGKTDDEKMKNILKESFKNYEGFENSK